MINNTAREIYMYLLQARFMYGQSHTVSERIDRCCKDVDNFGAGYFMPWYLDLAIYEANR